MKNQFKLIGIIVFSIFLLSGCLQQTDNTQPENPSDGQTQSSFPHLATYVYNGQDLLNFEEAIYDIVYSTDIDQETAEALKERNSDMIILYQSPVSYMFDSAIPVIEATTGINITDDFWLKNTNGQRCGYGWTPEIYAIDLNNPENIEIVSQFFSNVLEYQSQYDGLFFDVLEEHSRCDAMNDSEWSEKTAQLLDAIRQKVDDKIILANSGYNYNSETPYLPYLNGYAMESFLSGAAGYDEGLETVELVLEKTLEPNYLIYTVYSENTVTKQDLGSKNMRLALTLSLLNDNTYLAYEQSLEEVGSILWQQEFSAALGSPKSTYYEMENAYWREFENGVVISSPYFGITAIFDEEYYIDATTGEASNSYEIEKGDGKVLILNS
jgi:hypothetical protein